MTRRIYLILLLVIPTAAMAGGEHAPGEAGAAHDHAPAAPSITVTQWSDELELFLEYPLLLAEHAGEFVIHLTVLEGFQPIGEGSVDLRFSDAGGRSHSVIAYEMPRAGVFVRSVTLPHAGSYELELRYRGPELGGSFLIEGLEVLATAEDLPAAGTGAATDAITFLKEQQWQIPFATTEAELREIKRSFWAIGEVLAAPTAYVEIDTPADGVVQADDTTDLALPGSRVQRGDVVATILPSYRGDGWATSQLAYEQAERNYERARRLQERDAISQREFEEIEHDFQTQKARREGLASGAAGDLIELVSPINGKVIDWQVSPGQRLQAGDNLMTIADASVVWLQVNVYERDVRNLGVPVGVHINPGSAGSWTVADDAMRVLTTGGALDPVTRTVPVLLEVDNGAGRLTINETTPVELYTGESSTAVAVPQSSLYEDEGLQVVFVQTGGESFAKRVVTVGAHHAGWVSILDGLAIGERVVSLGGYHVKLAATTAEIGHGHAH